MSGPRDPPRVTAVLDEITFKRTSEEAKNIKEWVHAYSKMKRATVGRVRAYFGFRVDEKGVVKESPEFPNWLSEIASECNTKFGIDVPWNQCIVNKYENKQGISKHVDDGAYGNRIMTFVFNGARNDELWIATDKGRVKIPTPANSAYLLQGDIRWCPHERPARARTEPLYVVTFRNVVR